MNKPNLSRVLRALAESPEACVQAVVEDGSCVEYLRMAADLIDSQEERIASLLAQLAEKIVAAPSS